VVLASVLLAAQARHYPSMIVTWAVVWICGVGAPVVGTEVILRRLTHPSASPVPLRRLLLAPLVVFWLMLVTLFDVVARLGTH
jgi:hypothetical protein